MYSPYRSPFISLILVGELKTSILSCSHNLHTRFGLVTEKYIVVVIRVYVGYYGNYIQLCKAELTLFNMEVLI